MMLENELVSRLLAVCPRVFTPAAQYATQRPYITWQSMGGEPTRSYENEPFNIKNALIQVSVWSDSKSQAVSLIAQVEDELCKMTTVKFTASPVYAPRDIVADNGIVGLAGAVQLFSIWGNRT